MGKTFDIHKYNAQCEVCTRIKPVITDIYGDWVCHDCFKKFYVGEDDENDGGDGVPPRRV